MVVVRIMVPDISCVSSVPGDILSTLLLQVFIQPVRGVLLWLHPFRLSKLPMTVYMEARTGTWMGC